MRTNSVMNTDDSSEESRNNVGDDDDDDDLVTPKQTGAAEKVYAPLIGERRPPDSRFCLHAAHRIDIWRAAPRCAVRPRSGSLSRNSFAAPETIIVNAPRTWTLMRFSLEELNINSGAVSISLSSYLGESMAVISAALSPDGWFPDLRKDKTS